MTCRFTLFAALGVRAYEPGDGAARKPPPDTSAGRAKLEAALIKAHTDRLRKEEALRECVRTLTRERDEALAALSAEIKAHRITSGQLECAIDASAEGVWMARALDAERELALAYPRALRAAAETVREVFYIHRSERVELAEDILALTPEDIERIAKEHEHG